MKKPLAKRIIKLIEKLSLLYQDGTQTKQQAESIINLIYKFAHLKSNCKNLHLDWLKEFYKTEKALRNY